MGRWFGGLAAGIILFSILLPMADICPAYPVHSIDQYLPWSANDCFDYATSITIDNSSHVVSTAKGYFTVLLEGIVPSECTATLKIEQSTAFRGANPVYLINVPIQRVSYYIPYLHTSSFHNVSLIMNFLNFSYGQGLYSVYLASKAGNIMNQTLKLCEITFNSLNVSGRILADTINGLIVEGTVICNLTDFNLQKNIQKNSTFMLEETDIPLNTATNPADPSSASLDPGYLIYFYYSIIAIFAFLSGILIIWLLRYFRS
jgi:hypothetical protein